MSNKQILVNVANFKWLLNKIKIRVRTYKIEIICTCLILVCLISHIINNNYYIMFA